MDRRFERRTSQRYPGKGPSFSQGRRPDRIEKKADRPEWDNDREIDMGTIADFMREHWMILTIVLIGISLRIMFLNHESFWIDEAMTGLRSRWDLEYMLDEVTGRDQMPLYFLFTWFVAKTFGNSVLVLRGLSVIFGTIAFIPVYKIGRRFNREAAIIGLLLFSLSPTMIYYSQEARMYMLMVLLSASSIYFYLEFINPLMMKKGTSGLLMVIINVILVYIHYFGIFFVGLQLLAMISDRLIRSLRSEEGLQLKQNILGCWPIFTSILTFLPWLIYQQVNHSISEKTTGGSLGLGMELIPETFRFIGGQYTAVFKYDTDIAIISGYIFLVAVLLSIVYLIMRKKKDPDLVSFLVLGAFMIIISPFLLMFLSHNLTPMYNHRYLIFMVTPFFLFISLVLSQIRKDLNGRGIQGGILVVMVLGILLIPSLLTDVDQLSRRDKADWKGGIDLILENQEVNDVVLPFPDHEQMLIYYYTDELDIELMGRVENLSKFMRDHDRVWVIFYQEEPIDDQPLVRALNSWHMEEYGVEKISVRLYIRQFEA